MSRTTTFIFILAGMLTACRTAPDQAREHPNIVIFLSDDQGWGDFSISGNTNIETPNIDKLALDGAIFNNFYVQAVCSPTRAELLTGRYHTRCGVYSTSAGGERINLDETTLAEVFSKAGYATAGYGKWHNGMQPPYHPNSRGFDDFYGFCSGHWGNYFDPILEHNGAIVRGEGFIIDDLTQHGIDFIESHKEGPFLLYLPYNTPHGPFQVPDRWYNKFEQMDPGMRAEKPEDEDIASTRAILAMCENIDWNVGRIIKKLEEAGIEENTIVIYFTDNGPNSWRWNGGMKGRKGSTDEGGVRTQFFIKWPARIKKGKQIEQLASVVDLLPTLTDLAGIENHSSKVLDGISLEAHLLQEDAPLLNRYIVNQWKDRISVRSQNYRLDAKDALFDIENDREQRHEVSAEHPEIRKELMEEKARYVADVVASLPEEDLRPFPIGYPGARYTQIPARDGMAHGLIKRSNRFPNCSYFTNWIRLEDQITWNAEVLEEGDYNVTLYYTCRQGDEGSLLSLSMGRNTLECRIKEAHDPPLRGMENDRNGSRGGSYVKDFKALDMGTMHLEKGTGTLSLKALEKPGQKVIDFRLLMFEKI